MHNKSVLFVPPIIHRNYTSFTTYSTNQKLRNTQSQLPSSLTNTVAKRHSHRVNMVLSEPPHSKLSSIDSYTKTTSASPKTLSPSQPDIDIDQNQWVYSFSCGKADGSGKMKSLLGGKGAGLAEMCHLSLPVPPGFTLTTSVCKYFTEHVGHLPRYLKAQVHNGLKELESLSGYGFGNLHKPLLLSVRSGAAVSMPGMMDTVLNLGLNDETVKGIEKQSGNRKFALDSYRRFIQMFGNVVMGIDMSKFDCIYDSHNDGNEESLVMVIGKYKELFKQETGIDFIQDVNVQLWYTINAVFKSWNNPRAVTYRKLNDISSLYGTAVTVQAMVFGNMGTDCATGVVFTRNPSTGENEFYGEYLQNAQGEDVVAGIRTPLNIQQMRVEMPDTYNELERLRLILESHFKDVQDIEFTIQESKLYLLQTRNGKRSAGASVKIAVDMVKQGLLSKEEAILRIDSKSLHQLLHPTIDPEQERDVLTTGLPASPGAAHGKICLSAGKVKEMHQEGEKYLILCTEETSPEDIEGMHLANGVLTRRGGMTSHAAVVARGMGTCAVTGAGSIEIDMDRRVLRVGNRVLCEGDVITIDGGNGDVIYGKMKTTAVKFSSEFETLMNWVDGFKRLSILANAETAEDVRRALDFGAEGVGLCRTEHMFFDVDRIKYMRQMILAGSEQVRKNALDRLLPFQCSDFEEIFRVMKGLPVTIRFLDPPLHEFLPEGEGEIKEVAKLSEVSVEEVKCNIDSMKEVNPMLGLRGCRASIMYPEIYKMQAEAAVRAALKVGIELGEEVQVNLMVPFISTAEEMETIKNDIISSISTVLKEDNGLVNVQVGTMIELPRAALRAGDIAKHAEFFSFGTNDLTQTTYGMSRDDSAAFIAAYKEKGIVKSDPFVVLDIDGVGELIKVAVERGRKQRNALKLCLCGEQGGDKQSVRFCEDVGLDAVSCSPYTVPVARLAAAQAAIEADREG